MNGIENTWRLVPADAAPHEMAERAACSSVYGHCK